MGCIRCANKIEQPTVNSYNFLDLSSSKPVLFFIYRVRPQRNNNTKQRPKTDNGRTAESESASTCPTTETAQRKENIDRRPDRKNLPVRKTFRLNGISQPASQPASQPSVVIIITERRAFSHRAHLPRTTRREERYQTQTVVPVSQNALSQHRSGRCKFNVPGTMPRVAWHCTAPV